LTVSPPGHHNGRVFRPLDRVVAAVVVVPFLALTSALLPVHAHEHEGGHSHVLVHSHFAPHVEPLHDHHGSEIEAAPDRVLWLASVTLHAVPYQADTPSALIVSEFDIAAMAATWSVAVFDDAAPPHGPPRSSLSLRAPPTLPV
jgi:hypothetical protein